MTPHLGQKWLLKNSSLTGSGFRLKRRWIVRCHLKNELEVNHFKYAIKAPCDSFRAGFARSKLSNCHGRLKLTTDKALGKFALSIKMIRHFSI